MYRLSLLAAVLSLGLLVSATAQKPKPSQGATAADTLKVKKDFKVELLYSVPRDKEGSWVNMCVDPKGRLIVSDQYGPLYRITPPPIGGAAEATKVEKLDLPIGEAQGLLFAFDSLYVVVNQGQKYPSGLYRIRTNDGGDTFGKVELLKKINGGGEHGPHAILLSPDGKSLTVVCGNQTQLVQPLAGSRVPLRWGEDHILPRMPDGNGFMKGVLAPGGCIYQVDPDGKNWELLSNGFRNEYDAAYNRNGDLFTYDADMEWDFNTPWYRPTRVCLVASGSEFGWRNGAGKWPAYYPDSLPAVFNVGPGSPTGVCFGYGAKFPAKYQDAFYICDWSYGKLYAVHLTPEGSAYKGEIEEFVTGTPLPLTDVVISPHDGAMYFTIGGRKTQSGLYRVTYVGKEPIAPSKPDEAGADLRAIRRKLEAFHGKQHPKAVETVWPYLKHEDRFIRYAARVALEHQDPKTWADKAIEEKDVQASLTALLALIRVSANDPFHRKPGEPAVDAALKSKIFKSLDRWNLYGLPDSQRIELLRAYEVLFNRMGPPEGEMRERALYNLREFPVKNREQNAELCQLLVYLEAPGIVAKALKMIAEAPTQEEQMEYARALRVLKTGWTMEQRREYFGWIQKAHGYKGGNSFRGFLRLITDDALASLDAKEKPVIVKFLKEHPPATTSFATLTKPRPFVKKYELDEVVPIVEKGLMKKRDFDRGRRLFGETTCFACHRFDNEGGSHGPDITGVAGRFNVRDLMELIVDPSKVISDQYAAVNITTTDGKVVNGRIVNLSGDGIMVMPNMLDPNGIVTVNRQKIESIETSKLSLMPTGLLDTLSEEEIADLAAYLLSGGNWNHKMFK